MHRIDVIGPEFSDPQGTDAAYGARWRLAQLNRAGREARGMWFDTVHELDFGRSIVLVGTPEVLRNVLRDGGAVPAGAARDALVAVRIDWQRAEQRLRAFTADLGMSPAIVRTIIALFRSGDVRAAASIAGLSYDTAREYLEGARTAVGAANLQRLMTFLGLGIASTSTDAEESDALLTHAFGLSERQTRIAAMIANGTARRDVARALGMSEALVKKELALVFVAVGVSNALALARAMVELRLLAIATTGPEARDPFPEAAHIVRAISARDGRTIAASDYGPPAGRPVLLFHSSMTSRPANRALVEALQNGGYRPIAVDRPGFGDTEPAPAACRGEAFFELAARDVGDFCDAMGWRGVAVAARGAAQVLLALQRVRPDLVTAAVIMNPDPDARSSSKRTGFLAAMKQNFVRRPWAVQLLARWAAQSLTYARVRDTVMRSTSDCPADARVMDDPRHMADYYRGVAAFRHGKLDGFVREQAALATIAMPGPLPGHRHFTLLVGEQDTIHHPDETMRYWRAVLPEARVEMVPGAGRFMSYSHPDLAVRALARSAAARPAARSQRHPPKGYEPAADAG